MNGLDVRQGAAQKAGEAPLLLFGPGEGGKVDADDKFRAERAAYVGGDGVREGAVVQFAPVQFHRLEEGRDGGGRRDGAGKLPLSQDDEAVVLPVRRAGGEGKAERRKVAFEIVFKEAFGKGKVGKGAQVLQNQ